MNQVYHTELIILVEISSFQLFIVFISAFSIFYFIFMPYNDIFPENITNIPKELRRQMRQEKTKICRLYKKYSRLSTGCKN